MSQSAVTQSTDEIVKKLKCSRCGYEWYPRTPDIKCCAHCKAPMYRDPETGELKVRGWIYKHEPKEEPKAAKKKSKR